MKLITTSEWGANEARNATPASHPITNPRGVTFHWIGPGAGGPWKHERCYEIVRGIERSHEYGNGWGDIAYNALPCPHGYVFEGRGPNVRSSANGDTGPNLSHYAACYLGGQGDPFTEEGKQAFRDAVAWLRAEGGAGPEINGHRDHKATACPGDAIYAWLKSGDAEPTEEDDLMALTPKDISRFLRRSLTKKGDYQVRNAFLKIRKLDSIEAELKAIRALLENGGTSGKA